MADPTLLARDAHEAMARRIIHYAELRLRSRDELTPYVAHSCAVAGAARAPFDDRALDAIFEIGRGNLRATDDLAFKSLDYAAAGGHAAVSWPACHRRAQGPRTVTSGRRTGRTRLTSSRSQSQLGLHTVRNTSLC
jgi:hypothetical protein